MEWHLCKTYCRLLPNKPYNEDNRRMATRQLLFRCLTCEAISLICAISSCQPQIVAAHTESVLDKDCLCYFSLLRQLMNGFFAKSLGSSNPSRRQTPWKARTIRQRNIVLPCALHLSSFLAAACRTHQTLPGGPGEQTGSTCDWPASPSLAWLRPCQLPWGRNLRNHLSGTWFAAERM